MLKLGGRADTGHLLPGCGEVAIGVGRLATVVGVVGASVSLAAPLGAGLGIVTRLEGVLADRDDGGLGLSPRPLTQHLRTH